jgi:hypothetical protein
VSLSSDEIYCLTIRDFDGEIGYEIRGLRIRDLKCTPEGLPAVNTTLDGLAADLIRMARAVFSGPVLDLRKKPGRVLTRSEYEEEFGTLANPKQVKN